MSVADFAIKRGDEAPALRATLKQGGDPFDLSTIGGVTFHMRRKGRTNLAVSGSATVVTASDGVVEYRWSAGDTDVTPGTYEAEFEVELSNGDLTTFPGEDYLLVEVVDDVD